MTNNPDSKNTIKSAYKIFQVMELLVDRKKLSLSEISQELEITKSTTQRILNTLKDLKYILQDNNSLEYFPSIKLYQLGNQVIDYYPIKSIAKPHLLELYGKVNETINLAILNEDHVVYLDKLVSTSPLRVELEIGTQFPIYSSALGKAIAAFNKKTYAFKDRYIPYTKNTISSDQKLLEELDQVKKLGYAMDREEYIEGLICIAVPVLDRSQKPLAAISMSIPTIRFKEDNISYYTGLLKKYSLQISKEMF